MHKLKYILAFFLLFSLLGSHNFLSADDEPTPESCFSFNSDLWEITGYTVDIVNGCGYSVNIPSMIGWVPVVSLGMSAFYQKGLNSVTLPNTITNVWVFALGSNNLTSIILPESLVSIGSSAFYQNQISSIHFPNSVTSIWGSAFAYNALSSLTIPEGITNISDYAFQYNQISTLNLPSSLQTIWEFSFFRNELTSLTIPAWVTSIWWRSFSENKLTTLSLPNGLITIGGFAFYNNKITTLDLPSTVTTIWQEAFRINNISWNIVIPAWVTNIEQNTFAINSITSVSLPSSLTSIWSEAFRNNELTSVFLPDTVTSVWVCAFCTNQITSVRFPPSISTIWRASFANNKLETLEIPTTVTSIGESAFNNNQLTTLTLPAWLVTLGDYSFQNNKIASLELPNWLEYIWYRAFSDNKLVTIDIPETVTSIWSEAFGNNELTAISLPENIETIPDELFYNNLLSTVHIPEWVTSIWRSAFSQNKITSLTLPSTLTLIWYSAFSSNLLTWVTLPNWLNTMYSNAFSDNQLESIELPSSLVTLWNEVFARNQLSSLILHEGMTQIPEKAFYQNRLPTVSIPSSITSIWKEAFGNNLLDEVYFSWSTINIWFSAFAWQNGQYNSWLASVNKYFEGKYIKFYAWESSYGEWWRSQESNSAWCFDINDGVLISYDKFCWPDVIIPDEVTSIGNRAFYQAGIQSVVIPDTIISILSEAFYNNKLTSIVIPSSVLSIWNYAFYNNKLTSVSLPEWLEYIWWYTFYGNYLTSVIIPSSVEYIWDNAFYDNLLWTISLENREVEMGYDAFIPDNACTSQNGFTYTVNPSVDPVDLQPNSESYYYNILDPYYQWESHNMKSMFVKAYKYHDGSFDTAIAYSTWYIKETEIYLSDFINTFDEWIYQLEYGNILSSYTNICKEITGSSLENSLDTNLKIVIVGGDGKAQLRAYTKDPKKIFFWSHGGVSMSGEYAYSVKNISLSLVENGTSSTPEVCYVNTEDEENLDGCQDAMEDLYNANTNMLDNWEGYIKVDYTDLFGYSDYFVISDFVSYESDQKIYISNFSKDGDWNSYSLYVQKEEIDDEGYWSGYWSWNNDGSQKWHWGDNMCDPAWEFDFTDGYQTWYEVWRLQKEQNEQKNAREYQQVWYENGYQDWLFQWCISWYYNTDEYETNGDQFWDWFNQWVWTEYDKWYNQWSDDGYQKWQWWENICNPEWVGFDFVDGRQTGYQVGKLAWLRDRQHGDEWYEYEWYDNGYQEGVFYWCLEWYQDDFDKYEINWDEYWDGYNEWYDEGNPHDDEDGESSSMTVTAIDKNGESFALEEVRDLDECESEIWCFMDDGDIMVKILSDKNIVKLLVNLWEEDEESTVYLSYDYKDVGESLGWYLSLNHFFAPKTHNDDAKWVTFVREVNFEQLRDWYEMGELYVTPTLSVSTKESKEDAYQTRDDFDKSKLFICNTKLQNFDNIEKNIDCYGVDERPQLDAGGGTYYIYGLQWLFYTDPKFLKVNVKFELYEKPYYGCTESCG